MLWPLLVPPLLLGAAIRTYNFFEGERLLHDLWYEFHLARTDIAALDRAWAAAPERSDIIVSLTTIPSRMDFLADTLKSLLAQTRPPRAIRLNLPAFSLRENRPYEIPAWLSSLASVRIVPCDDYGPATKLLPTLQDCAPGQPILVVDDDRIYARELVATLEAAAQAHGNTAVALGGWIAPDDLVDRPTTILSNLLQLPPAPIRSARIRKPMPVDILLGFMGYLVRPEFFDLAAITDYSAAPPQARLVDDVWISAHCRAPKLVVPGKPNFQPKRRQSLYRLSSLGALNRGDGRPENRHNSIMLRHFADVWTVGGRRRG